MWNLNLLWHWFAAPSLYAHDPVTPPPIPDLVPPWGEP
jgi:hypothetical protein